MIVSLVDRAMKLIKKTSINGDFVEFGVYKGASMETTIKLVQNYLGKKHRFYGFDTFTGIPRSSKPLNFRLKNIWKKGSFSDTSIEAVNKRLDCFRDSEIVQLFPALFNQLPPLKKLGIKKISMAYLDADIYEGYRDALELITPCLQIGTVIIFDEYIAPSDYRYQSIRFHGQKAIREWEEKTNLNLHLIRFQYSSALCVIVDENYLKKYGKFIQTLRYDNVIQSFSDNFYQLLKKINVR